MTIDNFVPQFNIPLITVQETQKFIDNLSSSKATGADEISVKVLKLVSPVFVQPLARLINLSIQSGYFPTKWRASHLSLKMAPKTVGTILDRSPCSPYCLKSVKSMLLLPLWITL